MKTRTSLLRSAVALAVAASLTGATALTAAAAPKDNKAELLTASAALASQSRTALSATGGSASSCKTWTTNASYENAYINSVNFARGLAGVTPLVKNTALTTYAKQKANYNCSSSDPGYSISRVTYDTLPGDPGGVRKALTTNSSSRSALLSTSSKYAAIGHMGGTYNGKANEASYVSSSSSGDYTWNFSKPVAWPSAGYFPVELSNGIWSYFGTNTGDSNTRPRLNDATISVKNSAGTALAVEKQSSGGWYSGSNELHFKVPNATVGTAKGSEASYTVTINGAYNYTGTYGAKKTLAPITYTVKLVRSGASFKYTDVAPKVTKQPASNLSVKVNKYINVSAGIFVPNQQEAKYQWEFKRKGESKWNTIWGADETTASITPQGLSLNGTLVRLRAESAGRTIYTNNITLKVTRYASTVKITKTSLKRNKKPAVTVKASQAGKVKVTVSKGKTKITKTVKVKKNKSTKVTLSKKITAKSSGKGKWKVTAKFYPTKSSLYAGKTATKKVTVK